MKLMKLAVILGLAGSSLAMFSSPAQAFKLFFDSKSQTTINSNIAYAFNFSLLLEPGDSTSTSSTNRTKVSFTFANPTVPTITGTNAPTTNSANQRYFNDVDPTVEEEDGLVLDEYGRQTITQIFQAVRSASYGNAAVPNNKYLFTVFLQSPNTPVTSACIGSTCYKDPGGFKPGGSALASVPEAESALVPVLVLGFGYLYRSKKRKNLQVVATQDQERSLV
ncbi:MAG TPA: hypothetical protein V6D15_17210 [Oculatellaceae cyanobacterium]|jgi:hypothetical protein